MDTVHIINISIEVYLGSPVPYDIFDIKKRFMGYSYIPEPPDYSISQEICARFCCALLCCGYAIVHNEFT